MPRLGLVRFVAFRPASRVRERWPGVMDVSQRGRDPRTVIFRTSRRRPTRDPPTESRGGQMSTGQYAPPGSQPGAGGARDDIPGAAQQAQGTAQNVAGQAQEQAQNFVGQAQEQAQQVAGQAKNRVREQIDQRSSQAGEQINQQAADLRSVSSSLREQGKDGPA